LRLVVDASVAVKWYTPEAGHTKAKALLDLAERIVAPDLIVPEVTNVAWAKALRGEISERVARLIATWIGSGVPALVPGIQLNDHALQIALTLRHPVYDCLYLACAELQEAPLVTDDQRFLRSVETSAWRGRVIALNDFSRQN
jgi:predicted nucleic acid-binding protein